MAEINKKQQLSPIPNSWIRGIAFRPPDFRALMATWSDPVVRRKGLSIYEEMLLDPQVSASLNLLKFAPLSLEYNVTPRDSDDEDAAELADEVKRLLESFPGGFLEFLYSALSALEYGWSITELVWGANSDKKWVPVEWIPLPQGVYGFEIDPDRGNPVGVKSWIDYYTHGEVYPLENFFILRWNARFGSPYGRSQLLSAYEPWWVKQLLRRMRNTALDRYGAPLLIAKVPTAYKNERRNVLKRWMENLYAESGLITDKDVDVEVLHSGVGQSAADGFQRAIEYEDSQIAKSITGAVLNANEAQSVGTYAQARVHQDNFLYWVRRVAKAVEQAVQEQIIDRYCRYNYGMEAKDTPVIHFADPEHDNIFELAQAIGQMLTMGVLDPSKDSDWIREKLGFPPPPQDDSQSDAQGDVSNLWEKYFKNITDGDDESYNDNEPEGTENAPIEEPEDVEEVDKPGAPTEEDIEDDEKI